jgi:signal transduction histidine kinase
MKVSTKLYLGVVLQFTVAVSLIVVVLFMQEKQDSDSAVINLAGRQRMLCQKMTKEILLFNRGACSAENILKTVEVFHKTLKALTYGGKAPLDLVQTQFTTLPVPESGTTVAQLKRVEARWDSFSDKVRQFLKEKKASSLEYVKNQNVNLLHEMNRAVFLMDREAAGKVTSLRRVLLWGSAALGLLFLLTLLIVRKNVQIIIDELKQSNEKLQNLNQAKSRVIHHLSHELKTPLSIIGASLGLLKKKIAVDKDLEESCQTVLNRAQRNLRRLLELQYEIGDILQYKDPRCQNMLSTLLDVCADELEVMVTEDLGEKDIVNRLRKRIDENFGPRTSIPEEIRLDDYVRRKIENLAPKFARSNCRIETHIESTSPVWIPADVLNKIVEGLVRNAIENTPEGSRIDIAVCSGDTGPIFEVRDNGMGISEENQGMIFKTFLSPDDPKKYASRKPYEFKAGGKGFDLFRMKVFSERYNFKIQMVSKRCCFISDDRDDCPGNVDECLHCLEAEGYGQDRGTTVTVEFPSARPHKAGQRDAHRNLN